MSINYDNWRQQNSYLIILWNDIVCLENTSYCYFKRKASFRFGFLLPEHGSSLPPIFSSQHIPFLNTFLSLWIIEYFWLDSHSSPKKHDFTFMETRFDNKLGIRPTILQAENSAARLSHTCSLNMTWKVVSLPRRNSLDVFGLFPFHVKHVVGCETGESEEWE